MIVAGGILVVAGAYGSISGIVEFYAETRGSATCFFADNSDSP